MSNSLQQSIEVMRQNPLTQGLPKRMNHLEMALALRFRPIIDTEVQKIQLEDRIHLVEHFKKIFIPTTVPINAAMALQDLLHSGLRSRNPLLETQKNFIYTSARLKDTDVSKLEWFPGFASGTVIDGITGMGKSQVVDRYLSLIPKVVDHGPGPGWQALRQLVYLKVHMPSDGTRGGFLETGFRALDESLGTSYTSDYASSRWRIEKKLVVFLHLLAMHRCGLLIIEEAQQQNLSSTRFSRDFLTFFLRILNWGIPTVLIGNPLAFAELRTFSQDVDRFSEGGWHQMLPVLDPNSSEWVDHWIPGLWAPTLLDTSDSTYVPHSSHGLDQTLSSFVWRRTGGVPRYLCRLRREVQEFALRSRAPSINASMIDQVYQRSPKMRVLHGRIEALAQRNWAALQAYSDMPVQLFRQVWASAGEPTTAEKITGEVSTAMPMKSAVQNAPKARTKVKKGKPLGSQESFQEKQIEVLFQASGEASGE